MQSAVEQPPRFLGRWAGSYTINVFVVVWVFVVGFGFGGWASMTNFIRQIDTFGLFTKCYQCPPPQFPLPPHLNSTALAPSPANFYHHLWAVGPSFGCWTMQKLWSSPSISTVHSLALHPLIISRKWRKWVVSWSHPSTCGDHFPAPK